MTSTDLLKLKNLVSQNKDPNIVYYKNYLYIKDKLILKYKFLLGSIDLPIYTKFTNILSLLKLKEPKICFTDNKINVKSTFKDKEKETVYPFFESSLEFINEVEKEIKNINKKELYSSNEYNNLLSSFNNFSTKASKNTKSIFGVFNIENNSYFVSGGVTYCFFSKLNFQIPDINLLDVNFLNVLDETNLLSIYPSNHNRYNIVKISKDEEYELYFPIEHPRFYPNKIIDTYNKLVNLEDTNFYIVKIHKEDFNNLLTEINKSISIIDNIKFIFKNNTLSLEVNGENIFINIDHFENIESPEDFSFVIRNPSEKHFFDIINVEDENITLKISKISNIKVGYIDSEIVYFFVYDILN